MEGDQGRAAEGQEEEAPGEGAAQPKGNTYLLCYAFNQDGSGFVCGTSAGFRAYGTHPVRELQRREHALEFQGRSVVLIATLFKTNIHAMVTACEDDAGYGGQNKVRIWDDKQCKFIGEVHSKFEVKGVALRRDVVAVACEASVRVYACCGAALQPILYVSTIANPKGLCALAAASEPWVLCCPGQSTGAIQVHVGQDDSNAGQDGARQLAAQRTALASLALSECGSLIATASGFGTVVKVFRRLDGQLLYRLRLSDPLHNQAISYMAFAPDGGLLAVALSSSSTVHIFRLSPAVADGSCDDQGVPTPKTQGGPMEEPPVQAQATADGSVGLWGRLTGAVQVAVPDYFRDVSSFAQFQLPEVGPDGQPAFDTRGKQARILGPQLAFHRTEPRLSVLHYNGMFYECSFRRTQSPNEGTQDCSLKAATTWFAVRPDFRMQGAAGQVVGMGREGAEEGGEVDEWRFL